MGFKGIKGFGLGKTRDKNDVKTEVSSDSAKVVQMKENLNTKTKGLEEMDQKLNGLISGGGVEISAGPHGPIGELSLDTEDPEVKKELDDEIIQSSGNEPVIKVIEMSKKPDTNKAPIIDMLSGKPKAPEKKAPEKPAAADVVPDFKPVVKPEAADDSLSNLFSNHEEEVNPLASLINSLPDVTVQELVDDLSEIKSIIKDWQKS